MGLQRVGHDIATKQQHTQSGVDTHAHTHTHTDMHTHSGSSLLEYLPESGSPTGIFFVV